MLRSFHLDNLDFWIFNAPFFIALLLLSVCSFSLIIEKCLLLFRWRCRKSNMKDRVSTLLRDGNIQGIRKILEGENCPESRIIRQSFYFIEMVLSCPLSQGMKDAFSYVVDFPKMRAHLGEVEVQSSKEKDTSSGALDYQSKRLELWVQSCIDEIAIVLEKHIVLFQLVANVATLLGLLGTVTGMIYAFQDESALSQSAQLAQGISQALATTACGLMVAIPAIVSQYLFQNTVANRIADLEHIGRDVLLFQQSRASKWSQEQAKSSINPPRPRTTSEKKQQMREQSINMEDYEPLSSNQMPAVTKVRARSSLDLDGYVRTKESASKQFSSKRLEALRKDKMHTLPEEQLQKMADLTQSNREREELRMRSLQEPKEALLKVPVEVSSAGHRASMTDTGGIKKGYLHSEAASSDSFSQEERILAKNRLREYLKKHQ